MNTDFLNEAIIKLQNILVEKDDSIRGKMVTKFDDFIFLSEDITGNDDIDDILADLAHNLEYYVSSPKLRKDFSGYYGNEQLFENINEALEKLENLRTKVE